MAERLRVSYQPDGMDVPVADRDAVCNNVDGGGVASAARCVLESGEGVEV